MSDTFESMVVEKPVGPAAGGFKMLSAAEAAEIAKNAGCRTEADLLYGIVNTRIHMVSDKGLTEISGVFGENAEHGFKKLTRPATEATKRTVLARLQAAGFTVDGFEGDPDQAVIRWKSD